MFDLNRLAKHSLAMMFFWLGATAATAAAPAGEPIRSASESSYPPFCSVDEGGSAEGFSVELMRAAVRAMGRDVHFRTGASPEVKGWLQKGDVQALPLVGRTPERETAFDFTVPYLTMHGAIVIRRGTAGIRALADLGGRTVAVMQGDDVEAFLRREDRGIALRTTASYADALRELSQGQHDAVVLHRLVGLRLIAHLGLTDLCIIDAPIAGLEQDYSFAVRDGDRELLALLNEGLARVVADGTYRRLHVKWFTALQIPSNRRLVIGGDENYPPFEFLDARGRPAGYNTDLTRALAQQLNLNVEIRLGPWAEMVRALEAGEIDALQGMFYSAARDRTVDFTPPHTVNHCVAVTRKESGLPPGTVAGLKGRRIVVQDGDIMHTFALEHGLGDYLTAVPAQEGALAEVVAGRQDCALVARMTALYWIAERGWKDLAVGQTPLLSPEYCYAVGDGNRALLAEIAEGLKGLEETGEYRRVYEKWIHVYEPPPALGVVVLQYVAIASCPLLMLAGGVALWSWSLRRQVARRTMELQRSEANLASLIENADGSIWSVDRQYRLLTGNSMFHETIRTARGRPFAPGECVLAEDLPQALMDEWRSYYDRALQGEQFRVETVRRLGAPSRYVEYGLNPIRAADGTLAGVTVFGRDVTERRKAEEALRRSEREKRLVLDSTAEIFAIFDVELRLQWANRAAGVALGCDSAALVGLHCCDIWHQRQSPCPACPVVRARDSGEPHQSEIQTADGRQWFVRSYPVCDEAGRVVSLVEFALEITERKRAEGEIRSLARFPAENPNPVVRISWDGIVQYANPSALGLCAELFGAGVGQVAAEPWRTRIADVLAANQPAQLELTAAGRTFMATLAPNSESGYANLYARDVTEERWLQAQLVQAQKIESIGRLAGGVAHDFNNLLTAILGYAELARDKLPQQHPIRPLLDEILHGARRSAAITRQLLAFARKQTIAPKVLDLNRTVADMLGMLQRLIGEEIQLVWIPGLDLWPVKFDPSQIDQILANLCLNARDAIAGVGKVTVETSRVTLDESPGTLQEEGLIPGEYVMLMVSDNGCGMDRQTREHLFEPFFTTKPVGAGTGLGLATVYGIVRQNNGAIHVDSEPGEGTTFRIYLPRAADAAPTKPAPAELASAQPAPTKPAARAGGTETILVVEDEPAVRTMIVGVLKSQGYTVLVAEQPREALRLASEFAGSIALLIVDVILPEMNGRELAATLLRQRPQLRCLYMSGYTNDIIACRGVLDAGLNFIAKPFSCPEILGKVREILDR